jgi:Asp-tRNA(Asn)/Glu-tRNA(Gln) amidotransferase A subunit family amidase
MVCDYISKKDVHPFQLPDDEEDASFKVKGIHLGTYLFWDDERQTEFVRDTYGWRETEIEQAYKCYKSAECMMPGMHDFTCYLKRGYSRATMQANIDVRNGLLTREEGFELIRKVDPVRPEALDYFLSISGMTEDEFHKVMRSQRLEQLRDVEIPVYPKKRPNREKILPFAVQIIERLKQKGPHPMELDTEVSGEGGEKSIECLPSSFLEISLKQIFEGYASGAIGPVDVAEICISAVNNTEQRVKAWEVFDGDKLLEQAEKSAERIRSGKPLRRLEGIPVGIKDIFNTRDFATQMGSPLWRDFEPGNDARAVFNLREAGAVIPGKTVTAEFAVHTLGKTVNPHDGSRNPGTSSSGSAAAVAMGMVPVAVGTQTAASITRPASFCGVYGCKPSFGLIPRTGILKTTDSLDTVGFFSVFLEDLEGLFEVMTVKGNNYPMSHRALSDGVRQEKPHDRPWRVALVDSPVYGDAAEYALEELSKLVNRLADFKEIEIIETKLPACMNKAHHLHKTIYDKTLSYYFREEFENSSLISPIMNDIIRNGLSIEPEVYRNALKEQTVLISEMDRFMKDYDILVSLATAGEAPLREEVEKPDSGLMWTMTHLPVVCAPVFTSPGGLPFGLQIGAGKYNDLLLFRFCNLLRDLAVLPDKAYPRPPIA